MNKERIKIKPLISVIVPVYNGEKFIEQCIDSITNQTLKNIEILIINDGSKDNTLNIIESIAKKDSRVKVLNQKNSGVSAARNNGISKSLGKYIAFVDADDYIDETMYEKMYKKAEEFNSDIVICNVNDVLNGNKKISLNLNEGIIDIKSLTEKEFLSNEYFNLGTAVWHKIFKSKLIKENKIKFINYSEVASEDTLFNYEAMLKAKRLYCIDEALYDYKISENSLTKSKSAKENMVKRCMNTVNIMSDFLSKNKIKDENFIDYITYWEFINALSYVNELKAKSLVNSIKEYSKISTFNKTIKKIALSSKLDKYFINHKGSYSITNKVFDKLFSLLCLCKLYYFAGAIHLLRLKRANKIRANDININGGEVFE